MQVLSVKVKQFRNLTSQEVKLSSGINIFVGDNGQGKTNFLEALYFSATGRSHRTTVNKELIAFNKEFAHITTNVKNYSLHTVDIHIVKNGKTGARLNKVILPRLGDLFGILHVVLFAPEDLSLIQEGPYRRRRFLDLEICQLSPVYYEDLQNYYKVLRQRNTLLKRIQQQYSFPISTNNKKALELWDEQLIHYGQRIMTKRKEFIEKLTAYAKPIHKNIAKEDFDMVYEPSVSEVDFSKKIRESYEKDIRNGATSYGIHRDDFSFYMNHEEAKQYASQGQIRTAVLTIKLAELELIKETKRKNPVLLLDDVFSELDEKRQKALLDHAHQVQTIMTCTGVESIIQQAKHKATFFQVKEGRIFI